MILFVISVAKCYIGNSNLGGSVMGSVSIRLEDVLIERARTVGHAQSRSVAKQIEHWAKIGKMMEENPELSYKFVQDALLAKAERDSGQLEPYSFG